MNWQGKTNRQIQFSYRMVFYGVIAIAILMVLMWLIETPQPVECAPVVDVEQCDSVFVPTEDDVLVLDTMLNQVQDIEKDIDTLHIRMNRIEIKIDEMLEEQDQSNNATKNSDELVMWIGDDGDTIWE